MIVIQVPDQEPIKIDKGEKVHVYEQWVYIYALDGATLAVISEHGVIITLH